MINTTQIKCNPRLHARLSTYATLAGVALTVPALAPSAKAAIIYSGLINLNVPSTTSGVYLNVITGVSAITPSGAPGWDLNPWGSGSLYLYGATADNGVVQNLTGGSSATLGDNLPAGTSINSTFAYGNGAAETTGATAFNLSSTTNYVGFRFLNETTGQVDYGWARLSLSTTYNGQPRSIIGYAYENTGAAIVAGAIPEPTTTALLGAMAVGAVGVRQWRQRRSA